jgi:hypothetical protein
MTAPTTDARVRVSWNGSGTFAGAYDDVTARVASEPGLTIDVGKDGARTLDPPKVRAVDFELFNDDGRFSQERADSPVYQLVLPGRPVDISIRLGAADYYDGADAYDADDFYDGIATYSMVSATIDDISETSAYGNRRVSFNCLGIEHTLVEGTITVGVMTAPRIDQCVTAILDAVGWPSGQRAISIADTTLLYWWCDERAPWDALTELARSEGAGAALYVEGGVIHFENRNYRTVASRSTTSQATFFDTALEEVGPGMVYTYDDPYDADDLYDGQTSGLWFTDFSYDPGFRQIRNRATYTTRQRVAGTPGTVVWSYGASLALAASQSVTLIARPNDPFTAAITPTTGGGDYSVAGGTVSVSLSAASGLAAFITVTATSGTPTVSVLRLRATPLTVAGETTVQNSVDASASIAKFSPIPSVPIPRVFDVQGWPEIGVAYAEAVCNSWVTRYMVQRPAVEITLQNADDRHVRQILERTVSDRITLGERQTGLSADVWVNGKQIAITGAGGRRLVCLLRCEKVEEVSGSVWDAVSSLWDSAIWGQ